MDIDDPFNTVDGGTEDVFSQIDDVAERVELLDLDGLKRERIKNWDSDYVKAVEELDVYKIQTLVFRKTEVEALLHPALKRVLLFLWRKDFDSINSYLKNEMQIHLMTKEQCVTLVFLLFSHRCPIETLMFLAEEVSLNIFLGENISPLIFAAMAGRLDLLCICCQYLPEDVKVKLREGYYKAKSTDGESADEADSHVGVCDRGRSALIYAALSKCPNCVLLLLTQGFSITAADKDGLTPLMCAAQCMTEHSARTLIEHLDQWGLIMNLEDKEKDMEINKDMFKDLTGGADVHAKNRLGLSALMFSAKAGSAQCLKYLIGKEAKVNEADLTGTTVLMHAVKGGHKACVEALMEHKAEINAVDGTGNSALMHAVQSPCMESFIVLLDHGADISLRNEEGLSAFLLSADYGNAEALNLLHEKGSDINETGPEGRTALHIASRNGHVDSLHFLLRRGADFSLTDSSGNTALDLANFFEHHDCSRILTSMKAVGVSVPDVSVVEVKPNEDNISSFMRMCEHGRSLAIEHLIKQGVDPLHVDKKGRNALMFAVRGKSLDCMNILLRRGLTVDAKDEDGFTALMLAAALNQPQCIGYLLTHGADVNIMDKTGLTAAMVAASRNSLESLRLLLHCRPLQIIRNARGGTFLIYATSSSSLKCIDFLMKEGYPVDDRDGGGKSLLMQAAQSNNVEIMTALLEHGCAIDERCMDMRTSLMQAALTGSVTGVQFLLMHGADVDARNEDEVTALLFSVLGKSFPCMSLLLQAGAEVNAADKMGSTAIKFAAQMGQADMVKVLLAHPDGVRLTYHGESSPAMNALAGDSAECLHLILDGMRRAGNPFEPELVFYAARQGILECLRVLLRYPEYKATDVDAEGLTVLMHASAGGNYDCIKFLFETKLDVNVKDHKGRSALLYACRSGNLKCIKYLWKKGGNLEARDDGNATLFMYAVASGSEKCTEFLLKHTRQLNAVDDSGFNALIYAIISRNVDVFKLLLRRGIKRDSRDTGGMSAFLYTALRGNHDVMEVLLDSGCKIEEVNDQGQTALILASSGGRDECLSILMERGADVKAVDQFGKSALHHASENGREGAMILLLDAGCEIDRRDSSGNTPFLSTIQDARLSCVRLLLEKGADVNAACIHMKSGLVFACCLGERQNPHEFVELLLSHNASVNAVDTARRTALNYAASHGKAKCVRALLEHGADISSFDLEGESAVSRSAVLKDPSTLKIIINSQCIQSKQKEEVEPFFQLSVGKASQRCLRAMIKHGFFKWAWLSEFESSLSSLRNIARVLVTMNIAPGEFEVDGKTISLLQFALLKDDLPTTKYLLANLYLGKRDMNQFRENPELVNRVRHSSESCLELRNLLPGLLTIPFNLQALCLMHISLSLVPEGASLLGRKVLVDSLPLPDPLKEFLNFERPVSKLCPQEWVNIEQREIDHEPNHDVLAMKKVVWTYPRVTSQCCADCAIDDSDDE